MAKESNGPWGDIELEEIPDLKELPSDLVKESTKKEWKTYGREGAEAVSAKLKRGRPKQKSTPSQIANLVQFRERDERSDESKKSSLEQLRVPVRQRAAEEDEYRTAVEFPPEVLEPDMLRDVLTVPEQQYFVRRWQEYMMEHNGDFNRAEDYDAIVEMILCYVHLFRIAKRKKNTQSLAWDRSVADSEHRLHIRIDNLRRDLKTSRKARLETQENKETKLMGLITQYAKDNTSRISQVMQQKLVEHVDAETEMLERKRRRTLNYDKPKEVIDIDVER